MSPFQEVAFTPLPSLPLRQAHWRTLAVLGLANVDQI